MHETRVLFIGQGPAHVDAGGGGRRTHQLLHELESHFGRDAILFLTPAEIFDNESDRRAGPQNTTTRMLKSGSEIGEISPARRGFQVRAFPAFQRHAKRLP